ncbi:hypothetical protein CGLO_05155 [Colletotrichum gloeosporioides Cg-14]|uniref:Uncharacterized protein n=1 Tax=Colletotrichum gloeosporioides (strain Cg-14) TaxID=1237896 RepID=T0KQR7_COLGC|nr:hypothetical protein CGLO_05155 [Colletotrichum gloeosporioides Cg-14]
MSSHPSNQSFSSFTGPGNQTQPLHPPTLRPGFPRPSPDGDVNGIYDRPSQVEVTIGSAEHVFNCLRGGRGLACPHFPKYTAGTVTVHREYPSRLGFFHASSPKGLISYLETAKFCPNCLDQVVPNGYNYWTMIPNGDGRAIEGRWLETAMSSQMYPRLYQAGTERFDQTTLRPQSVPDNIITQPIELPVPQIAEAHDAWRWMQSQRKPFYIDALHLTNGWTPFGELSAQEDSRIVRRSGQSFVMSRSSGAIKDFAQRHITKDHAPLPNTSRSTASQPSSDVPIAKGDNKQSIPIAIPTSIRTNPDITATAAPSITRKAVPGTFTHPDLYHASSVPDMQRRANVATSTATHFAAGVANSGDSEDSESEPNTNTTSDDTSGDETDGTGDFPEAIGVDTSVPSSPVGSTGQHPPGQSDFGSSSNNNGEPGQQPEVASHSSSPASQIGGQTPIFPGQQAQVRIHGNGVQPGTGIDTLPTATNIPTPFISQESSSEGFGQGFRPDAADGATTSFNGMQSASGAVMVGEQGSAAPYSTQNPLPGYIQQPVSQSEYDQAAALGLAAGAAIGYGVASLARSSSTSSTSSKNSDQGDYEQEPHSNQFWNNPYGQNGNLYNDENDAAQETSSIKSASSSTPSDQETTSWFAQEQQSVNSNWDQNGDSSHYADLIHHGDVYKNDYQHSDDLSMTPDQYSPTYYNDEHFSQQSSEFEQPHAHQEVSENAEEYGWPGEDNTYRQSHQDQYESENEGAYDSEPSVYDPQPDQGHEPQDQYFQHHEYAPEACEDSEGFRDDQSDPQTDDQSDNQSESEDGYEYPSGNGSDDGENDGNGAYSDDDSD